MSQRVRLHRFLADAGVASRRRAEELIAAGRVLVNGEVVDTLPAFVDPQRDRVVVDGAPVRPQRLEYFLLHKPKGVVCTTRDPAGRTRAIDLLPPKRSRVNVVGRLDVDSTGLLLLTNDGELAHQITHPRCGIPKVYRVEVRGQVPRELGSRLKAGVHLAEGKATATSVEIVHRSRERSVLQITLREGRNRQVRRMLARLGFPVRKLKRVQIGPLTLRGLPVGAWRRLTPAELRALREAVAAAQPAAEAPTRRSRAHAAARSRRKPSPKAAGGARQARNQGRRPAPRQQPTRSVAHQDAPPRRLVT